MFAFFPLPPIYPLSFRSFALFMCPFFFRSFFIFPLLILSFFICLFFLFSFLFVLLSCTFFHLPRCEEHAACSKTLLGTRRCWASLHCHTNSLKQACQKNLIWGLLLCALDLSSVQLINFLIVKSLFIIKENFKGVGLPSNLM